MACHGDLLCRRRAHTREHDRAYRGRDPGGGSGGRGIRRRGHTGRGPLNLDFKAPSVTIDAPTATSLGLSP